MKNHRLVSGIMASIIGIIIVIVFEVIVCGFNTDGGSLLGD